MTDDSIQKTKKFAQQKGNYQIELLKKKREIPKKNKNKKKTQTISLQLDKINDFRKFSKHSEPSINNSKEKYIPRHAWSTRYLVETQNLTSLPWALVLSRHLDPRNPIESKHEYIYRCNQQSIGTKTIASTGRIPCRNETSSAAMSENNN